jgi:hypothetical protein
MRAGRKDVEDIIKTTLARQYSSVPPPPPLTGEAAAFAAVLVRSSPRQPLTRDLIPAPPPFNRHALSIFGSVLRRRDGPRAGGARDHGRDGDRGDRPRPSPLAARPDDQGAAVRRAHCAAPSSPRQSLNPCSGSRYQRAVGNPYKAPSRRAQGANGAQVLPEAETKKRSKEVQDSVQAMFKVAGLDTGWDKK